MEHICLNLLEATVTLYPANADGTPQLSAPIWCGAAAESLQVTERWLKKETMASGSKYPRKHPLVAQYEVVISRLWVLPETAPQDWQAGATEYVLDVVWVEEETRAWHRKTFYGVTVSEHGWAARDVETGLLENQTLDAQYQVPDSGTGALPTVITATLPYQVFYTDVTGTILLYTYDPATWIFTAQADTTGRATVTNRPFAVQFANAGTPVAVVEALPAAVYTPLTWDVLAVDAFTVPNTADGVGIWTQIPANVGWVQAWCASTSGAIRWQGNPMWFNLDGADTGFVAGQFGDDFGTVFMVLTYPDFQLVARNDGSGWNSLHHGVQSDTFNFFADAALTRFVLYQTGYCPAHTSGDWGGYDLTSPLATTVVAGLYALTALPGLVPQLDFFYGNQRVFTVTPSGIYGPDFREGGPVGGSGGYAALGGNGGLVAQFTRGNVVANQLQVA